MPPEPEPARPAPTDADIVNARNSALAWEAAYLECERENAALRAACEQACVAMSLKYGHDRGTLEEGYEEVMSRHGGGMAYAYEMLRAALHAATAPAAPGEMP